MTLVSDCNMQCKHIQGGKGIYWFYVIIKKLYYSRRTTVAAGSFFQEKYHKFLSENSNFTFLHKNNHLTILESAFFTFAFINYCLKQCSWTRPMPATRSPGFPTDEPSAGVPPASVKPVFSLGWQKAWLDWGPQDLASKVRCEGCHMRPSLTDH